MRNKNITGSFDAVEWQSNAKGMREKRMTLGNKIVRLVEFTNEFNDMSWCMKGHTGFVLDGEMSLNINGTLLMPR